MENSCALLSCGAGVSQNARILTWLATLTESVPQSPTSKKRKRSGHLTATALPSPTMSSGPGGSALGAHIDNDETTDRSQPGEAARRDLKRRRQHSSPNRPPQPDDLEATPRPAMPGRAVSNTASDAASSGGASFSAGGSRSSASRTSSPTKQLRAVSLFEDGFVLRKFSHPSFADTAPRGLVDLATKVKALGRGLGVVHGGLKVSFLA